MLIGVERRFVFVANSKAASTSIETVLKPHAEISCDGTPQRKHMLWRDALRTYDFLFGQEAYRPETFFKFGVMRDPLAWIHSWFRYRKGNKVASPLPADMTFEAFWALDDWTKFIRPGRKRLQSDFFCARDGTVLVDAILPYDRLQDLFPAVCARLRVPHHLPHANRSRIAETEVPVSAALAAEIRAFYAPDYALLERVPEINARAGL